MSTTDEHPASPTGQPAGHGPGAGTGGLARQALAGFPAVVAQEPGAPGPYDERVLAAMGRVPRHLLIPELLVPVGEQRPARRWRPLSVEREPQEHLAACYGTDQVVVQLDRQPPGPWAPGTQYEGVPSAQSSGAGLIAAALTALGPQPGERLVEVGACTGYLAALAAELTGRRVTGVEIDPGLVRAAVPRLAAIGADVRMMAGDGLRGLPGRWDVIAASCAVRSLPAAWPAALAPGGRLLTTVTTGAPGWAATLLVRRDEHGALSGQLACGLWGHVPDRATGWLPLPPAAPPGPGRCRTAVLAPPVPAERGFWVALGHLLPGVRRHWRAPGLDEEAVVLVDSAGSRAEVAPDGSQAVEWGPRALWAQAEAVHARWTAAGRPAVYEVEFDGHRIRVADGTGLSWELPMT